MELLKALIALGGGDVPTDKLIDILWTEPLEGDEQKAFDVTVHRLRKLLGHEKAIQVTDRRVSLNPQIVWVDLWALERKLAPLIPAAHATAPDAAELSGPRPGSCASIAAIFSPATAIPPGSCRSGTASVAASSASSCASASTGRERASGRKPRSSISAALSSIRSRRCSTAT